MDEYIQLFTSGGESRRYGVGFLVSKDLKGRTAKETSWGEINDAYAPPEEKIEDEKEEFYEKFKKLYDNFSNHNVRVVFADMNTTIGRDDKYKDITGGKVSTS